VCSVARDGIPEGSTVDVAVSWFNRRRIAILGRPDRGADHGSSQGPVVFSTGSLSGGEDPAGRLQSVLRAAEAGEVHIQAPGPEASHLAALAKLGELRQPAPTGRWADRIRAGTPEVEGLGGMAGPRLGERAGLAGPRLGWNSAGLGGG
jgi:hypothetical protein